MHDCDLWCSQWAGLLHPGYSACASGLESVPTLPVQACLDWQWQLRKAEETRVLAVYPFWGGVGNGVTEEDECWDLNSSPGSLNHKAWEGEAPLDHVAWEWSRPRGLKGCRRTPTSLPPGGTMWFWKKSRSLAKHRLLGEARNAELRLGGCWATDFYFFSWETVPLMAWFARGGRTVWL